MPERDARRVAVKTHFVRMSPYGAKAALRHLGYIQRDGVAGDGSPGILYGPDGPVEAAPFEQPRDGERHQFRIIISPDDGHELDLAAYVRRVMARVARDTGRQLEWAAVNHFNTDHPHAHVVVRGLDRQGCEVRFDRAYISNGMRWRAQQIATEELGPRSEFEIRRAQIREVTQERFTSLDRELERRMHGDRVPIRAGARPGHIEETILLARLKHLASMELAVPISATEWQLHSGWQPALRDLAVRRDIIKQMHAAVAGDPAHYQIVGPGQPVPSGDGVVRDEPLLGRVAAKGFADELKGTFYAVLETPGGTAYRVCIGGKTADSIRTGDFVTFGSKREAAVLAVDRHIAAVAGAYASIYAPALAGGSDLDEPRAAAHRLRTLERSGLVASESPGRWRVPPDLLERLEKRHAAEPPRYQLFVRKLPLSLDKQVDYRGPVWLDRVPSNTLAPSGLGAEVARAAKRRNAVLRELGIDPDDINRLANLSRLERDVVAEQFAKRSRQAFVRIPSHGLPGRAQEFVAPSGASYAIVSDGQRFAVVQTTQARRWHGKAVTLTRDAKGRPVLREAPERGLE